MLKSNFKIAIRSLINNKAYSLINIAGLSMTLVSAIFISVYLENEFGYDKHHKKREFIYRLSIRFQQGDQEDRFDITAHGLGDLLKSQFPEIEHFTRFYPVDGNVTLQKNGNLELFKEDNFYFADQTVFEVFTHPMLLGDPKTALSEYQSIVLSESLARKYFGKSIQAFGATIHINDESYQITGIMKDPPKNAHLYFDALLSTPPKHEDWPVMGFDAYTYLLFRKDYNPDIFQGKLAKFDNKVFLPLLKEEFGDDDFKVAHSLDPLVDTHFLTEIQTDLAVSPKSNAYIFAVVGILLLFITSLNSINLSLSNVLQKNRDVGIRKVVGASKTQILLPFASEAIVIGILSLIIALTIQQLLTDSFYQIIGKQISISFFKNSALLLVIIGILTLNIIFSVVPKYFIVLSNATLLLRKQADLGDQQVIRNGIMMIQLCLSLLVITGAMVAYQQFTYMKSIDLGFDKEQVMVINLPGIQESKEKAVLLKDALLKYPEIKAVSLGHIPMEAQMVNTYTKYGEKNVNLIKGLYGDEDYLKLLGLELIKGKNFSGNDSPKNQQKQIIINQSFAKMLGWEDPIGKKIDYGWTASIVGVVKDYHFRSLHHEIEPLMIEFNRKWPWHILIRKNNHDVMVIQSEWSKVYPDKPFAYRFLDEDLSEQYSQEASLNKLLWYFSLLVILLTCSGLYGISFYTIVRRTKEIGIRKILGATLNDLIYLLSRDFVKVVLMAFMIAIPIGVLITRSWIERYAYRIELEWYLYGIPTIMLLLIAAITMSFHTLKTARANPVEALRYE